MNQSEYEKLCDEAFGKPEKRNWLKEYKRLFICAVAVLILVIGLLSAFLLREPDSYVHREVKKPVWLEIQWWDESGFRGIDTQERVWWVNCDTGTLLTGTTWCRITFEGEPSVLRFMGSTDAVYEVTADRCWTTLVDDRLYVGRGYDICEFDIDRDGVVEQCILGFGTTSVNDSFELSVWDGELCEERVFLAPDENYYFPAFYTDGQELKIAWIWYYRFAFYEETMDVVYADGKLEVLTEGEAVETLPGPAMYE